MNDSDRLSATLALADLLQQHSTACDLLVSTFAAAVRSGRKATVCKPFASHLFGPEGYNLAAATVEKLCTSDLSTATDLQLRLLQWLLLHLQRAWVISHCTAEQLLAEAQSPQLVSALRPALQQPCCIFKVQGAHQHSCQQQPSSRHIVAFHGTDFANLHSILQQGLLAASGTRLQVNGALFGQGLYLSTDFNTAFSFTKGREAWHNSTLGRHLRCVLVCEVAEQAALQGNMQHASTAASLPMTYIVAPRPSDVVIRYLLVFSDDNILGHGPSSRLGTSSSGGAGSRSSAGGGRASSAASACWALTCAYLGCMLLFALWNSKLWKG